MPAQLLDHAFAHNMVGQTAKGLGADDIVHTAVDQLQHLSCEEPSLAGLVAQGHKALGHLSQFIDGGRGRKMHAGFQLFLSCPAEILQQGDTGIAQPCGRFLGAQVLSLKVAVIKTV